MSLQRVTLIDRTDFKLVHRVRYEGAAATLPVNQQRQILGFNSARVFASCRNLFHLDPYESGSLTPFLDDLGETADLLAFHGSYMHTVVFADAGLFNWGKAKQLQFWGACGEVAQAHPTMLLSAVNEENHGSGINRLEALADLPAIPGVLCSRGSYDSATWMPPEPFLQWGELHTNGQPEWWRKSHNTMEVADHHRGPAVTTEKPRAGDQDSQPNHHEDDAAVGALLVAGSTFHSPEGRYSQLFPDGGIVWQCAQAFVKGARSVPLEFQAGRYNRIDDPAYLRTYQRILPDGRAHTVRVRA